MNKKINWITGLKGVSALVIFIHHFALFFYPALIDGTLQSIRTSNNLELKIARSPFNIFGFGAAMGVCMFFTISGFLIAYNYYKRNRNYDISSTLKRYLKLMIPVLVSSVIIFLIVKSRIFRTEGLIKMYSKIGLNNNYASYNENIFNVIWSSLITLFRTSSFPINPPMWTMKLELIYSVVSMLIINMIGKSNKRYLIYIFIIFITLNSYFLCFILGIALCDIWLNNKAKLESLNKWDIKLIILFIGLFLISSTYLNQDTFIYEVIKNMFNNIDYIVTFHSIGVALLILYFLLSDKIKNIFSKKIFVFFGKQSLGIYLFHWVIINTVSMYIVLVINKYLKYYQSTIISFVLTLIIVMFFSCYFTKYINIITNKITKKIDNVL